MYLSKLRAGSLEEWKERVLTDNEARDDDGDSVPITPSTFNRLLNDLRAALNRAGQKYRRQLPVSYLHDVKAGTAPIESRSQPRRQLLTDEQVAAAVEAAFEVDDTGDFGRLVLVLAATGARHSQAGALAVADLQVSVGRVMMPGSRKGRARKPRPPVPIPLEASIIQRLGPAVQGRDLNEPLLMRWHHRKEGKCTWVRVERRPWGGRHTRRTSIGRGRPSAPAYQTEL